MPKKMANQPSDQVPNQTPFERFKAAASQVLSFQKPASPKPPKKAKK